MMNNKLIFPFSRYYSPIVTWMKLSMNTIMQESVFLRMTVAFFLIAGVIGVFMHILGFFAAIFLQSFSGIADFFSQFFTAFFFFPVFISLGIIFLWLDIPKAYYNLTFRKNKWWNNTGISIREITEDQGLYGEYAATVAAELNMKQNKMYGEIFNNVIIPKKDGDFNEIDVIMICEAGIFVIEAKARHGDFSGTATSASWQQTMGNEVHELPNPFIQNLGHCNYLAEYLHEKLPAHIRSQIDLRRVMVNTVLFGLLCNWKKVAMVGPITPFYMGYSIQTFGSTFIRENLIKSFGRNLTPEQIDAIANALRPISFYPKQTREQMINERQFRQEHGDFRHAFSYYIANGVWSAPYQGNGTMICRDNGLYKTYLEMEDHQFHAYPNFQVTGITYRSRNLDDVVQEYYRRRG